jgi:ADP-ribosylation factor related protein 1
MAHRSPIFVTCCTQSLLERIKAIFIGLEPLPPGKIPPTVGLNIGRMQVNRTKLIFWDLGGASSLRSLWSKCASLPL